MGLFRILYEAHSNTWTGTVFLTFSILQHMKYQPFYILPARKRHPFWAKPPRIVSPLYSSRHYVKTILTYRILSIRVHIFSHYSKNGHFWYPNFPPILSPPEHMRTKKPLEQKISPKSSAYNLNVMVYQDLFFN